MSKEGRTMTRPAGLVLLLVASSVASCEALRPAPTTTTTQPAAPAPSAAEVERQRQLALLLEKIAALEERLATRPAAHDATETSAVIGRPVETLTTRPAPRRLEPPIPPVGHDPALRPVSPPPAPAQEVTLAALIEALETRSKAEPRNLALKRQLRVLYLLAGRDEDALEAVPGAGEAEKDFWRQMMWVLVNYTDDSRGLREAQRAGAALKALDDARRALARQAPLDIRRLTFCTDIRSFGAFTAVERPEFKAGQMVLLYLELDGYTTVLAADRQTYRVLVRQDLELLTPRGDSVWTRAFGDIEDLCQSPRTDFYFYSKFALPDTPPGQYLLKVTMTDVLGHKAAEETMTIQVK
jgi:hypothetical protein